MKPAVCRAARRDIAPEAPEARERGEAAEAAEAADEEALEVVGPAPAGDARGLAPAEGEGQGDA
jgi:hypothetical protein